MTVAEDLVARVSKMIQDSSFSDEDILAYLNQGQKEIAAGPVLSDGSRLAPLSDLFTNDTVSTATDSSNVSLPSDFCREVRAIVSKEGGEQPKIVRSFERFLKRYPLLDETGTDVRRVCVVGKKLYYQPIPTSSIDLVVYYYRLPTDMSIADGAEQTEPDGLPDHLCDPLLVNYAAREIFKIIDGDDGMLAGTINKHDAAYQKALHDLSRFVGPMQAPAWNVGYEDDYEPMWFEVE